MKKALHEMSQVYDRPQLAYRFRWFASILRRTTTVTAENKQIIEKEFEVQFDYKELIQDDPIIQSLLAERELQSRSEGEALGEARGEARGRAEGEARGKAEGILEGEIKATKDDILCVLTARFSAALADRARSVITPMQNADMLKMIFQQVLRLPDEQTVRIALGLPTE
jgi:flagellar biosynthesis/type III secretory pathway protein FliH